MSTLNQLLKAKAEKDERESAEKVLPSGTKSSQVVPTSANTSQVVPTPTNQPVKFPTSPTRNFTKVQNSITSEAIPKGMFKGLSKHTYDVLYILTRGAINPRREVQLTRFELMQLTGLSENTQRVHIKYLSVVGLVKVRHEVGKPEGSFYEVLVPEELEGASGTNTYQVVPSGTNYYQELPSSPNNSQELVLSTSQELVGVGTTLTPENIEQNTNPNTLLNTNNKNDDEPFGAMLEVFKKANEKISGKRAQKSESSNWKELAELLIMELEIAVARTTSISNVPAFLTEHLRRRLLNKPSSSFQPTNTVKDSKKPPKTTEAVAIEYTAEPLTDTARQTVLKTMREYVKKGQKEFVMSLQDSYTKEDWEFLIKELKK